MRYACGSQNHPDPQMFSQIFRLLCTFSLVNPPKGGNVTGGELLEPLIKDKADKKNSNEKPWLSELDKAIEEGINNEPADSETNQEILQNCNEEHNYDVAKTSKEVVAHMAGWVAFRMKRFTMCAECRKSMITEDIGDEEHYQFISYMSKGNLCYPTKTLFKLIMQLEDKILHVVGTNDIHLETLIIIFKEISKMNDICLIGCKEHVKILTKKIIEFYVTIRGEFIAKSYNISRDERKQKTKKHRKLALL